MLTEPPSEALDLLVVGALTIDGFADGSTVPGGSVMHIARAAVPRGFRLGVVTIAGPEPEARAGLIELRRLAAHVEATLQPATTTFRHRDSSAGRRLWLERTGGRVAVGQADYDRIATRAILFAPVAGEITADALPAWDDRWTRGAILQGWLRGTTEGVAIEHLPLSSLAPPLLAALRPLDVLVASREDLIAEAEAPVEQLAALRDAIGAGPALFVTDGPMASGSTSPILGPGRTGGCTFRRRGGSTHRRPSGRATSWRHSSRCATVIHP